MTDLSRDDIAHLGRLARLELTDEESVRYAGQLSSVVHYVEQLQAVDTSKVKTRLGVTGMSNILAADEPRVTGSPADIDAMTAIAHAPRHSGRFIEVRAVLGGEVETA
jgi:aspartyl-tRNA(Asn)/glutamyl-tRNA(Gln) amidotransferase subunit C